MPIFTSQVQAAGALINIKVEVSAPRVQAMRAAGLAIPQAVSLRALIDSGADSTFVDARHLQHLNLQNPLVVLVADPAGGFTLGLQYEVSLTLLHPVGVNASNLVLRMFAIVDKPLSPGLGFEAIVGRDVLDRCLFCYDGPAQTFTLAY